MTEQVPKTQTLNDNPSVEVVMGPWILTMKCKVKSNHGRLIKDEVVIFEKGDIVDVPDDEETKEGIKRGYLREIKDENCNP